MPVNKSRLQKNIQTALIISMVLVLRNFSYMVSFGGGSGMRISFAGIFSRLPALLFGPLYGAVSGGLCDILGYIIKPEGPYIFPLTLVSVLCGFLIGLFWKKIKNINYLHIIRFFVVAGAFMFLLGVFNHSMILFAPETVYGTFLSSLGKRQAFYTVVLEIAGLLFVSLTILNYFLSKKNKENNEFIKVLVVILSVNLLGTTINTFILYLFIPGLKNVGFLIYYLTRVIEEITISTIQSFVTTYILKLYYKVFHVKEK